MAFAGLLRDLLRDKEMGRQVVPIIPDEARTFGMDSLFPEVGIYASTGQLYEPVDAHLLLSYKESKDGQILEEGITEAGSMASFTAAGTAHAVHGVPMVPFFIFYSMFGFQRVGDLIWAFGDSRGRGFLCGATAGRTTLHGEGLQHADGHSLVLASTVPNLAAYDPAFAYELAVIIEDGLRRMYGEEPEDVFYYLTLYNENYVMPAMPEGMPRRRDPARAVPLRRGAGGARPAGDDAVQRHRARARPGRRSGCWPRTTTSPPSCGAPRPTRPCGRTPCRPSGGTGCTPPRRRERPYVTEVLSASEGPFVAVTDFMKAVPDQVARWVPGPFVPLGTDGYGRSDTSANLRRHFETDAASIVTTVLQSLAQVDEAKPEEVADALARYSVDTEVGDPRIR